MPFVSTSRRLGRVLRALLQGRFGVEGWRHYVPMDLSEGDGELSVKAALLNEKLDAEERYSCLFQYFLRGFIAYASPGSIAFSIPAWAAFMATGSAAWKVLPGRLPSWRPGSHPAAIRRRWIP